MKSAPQSTRTALALAIALSCAPAGAESLQTQAQGMFDAMGVIGNTTAPQAFKGQTMNTYTAGSMFVRTPIKSYQLAAASMPSVRAGCGGIDVFGGSFSHISSEQLKAMMKNITSAIPGVLFQLAIDSVEPLLGSTIKTFQGWLDMVNRSNISSCEAAKSLVNGAAGAMGLSAGETCRSIASLLGMSQDVEDGRVKCSSDAGYQSVMATSNEETDKIKPFVGNLVWKALEKMSHLDDEDRELIMSITGTTIYSHPVAGESVPLSYPGRIGSLKDLLYGNKDGTTSAGTVLVSMLKCANADCSAVAEVSEPIQSFVARAEKLMISLSEKIASHDTPPTEAETNFVNNVSVPVYRLLAVANAIGNAERPSMIAPSLIAQYREYIAIEYAHALLSRAARSAQAAGLFNHALSTPQRDQLAAHMGHINTLLAGIDSERQVAAQKAQVTIDIAGQVESLERNLRASMPQQIQDLLAFSALGSR